MSVSPVEITTKQYLVRINEEIGEKEQQGSAEKEQQGSAAKEQQGSAAKEQARAEALEYFSDLLSDQLMFRRASGKVVGKAEPGGFLDSLKKESPFSARKSEAISVDLNGDRALVTLIVVGIKADGSEQRYRNIRLFSRPADKWILEFWYNYEVTSL